MPFNLFPILWRLLLLRMNKLLNFQYFFRNFTCNSPMDIAITEYYIHASIDRLFLKTQKDAELQLGVPAG